MKKNIFTLLCALSAFTAYAQQSHTPSCDFDNAASPETMSQSSPETTGSTTFKDITVSKVGTLAQILENDFDKVDSIVVRGPINAADFNILWRATFHGKLTVANLEYAIIEDGAVPDNAFWHNDEQCPDGEPPIPVNLRRVILPEGVKTIGDYAFGGANNLQSINMPKSLRKLGRGAFASCTRLNTAAMLLPEGLSEIPERCFASCYEMREITLPSTVKNIGKEAFSRTNLSKINFPDVLESIGERAFFATKLEEAVLPATCTDLIGDGQFGCTNLKRLEMQGAVKNIPRDFAKSCVYLEELALPSTIKTIGANAFNGCTGLKSISLPEGLREIMEGALYRCTALQELTLPSTLTFLGEGSCQELKALKSLCCKAGTPPECGISYGNDGGTPFVNFAINSTEWLGSTSRDVPLYVPKGTKELYRAGIWGHFSNIIETDFTGITGITVDNQPSDGACHDLFGRKVTGSATGQVLIQNGKKMIRR